VQAGIDSVQRADRASRLIRLPKRRQAERAALTESLRAVVQTGPLIARETHRSSSSGCHARTASSI